MVRMKLFDAGWAPSPRRVRIFLAEKGVEVETVSIDLRTDEQLAPAYLAVNPRGTVPTLILDNGTVIDESTAICRYFKAVHPEPNLFGQTPVEDRKRAVAGQRGSVRVETGGHRINKK